MREIVVLTKELCRKEKELEAQIIRNLIEISNSRLHLEMGYSNLFNFCVEELCLSHGSAQRKIDVVRLSHTVPELPERIEKGEISVSKVTQVAKFVRQEKKLAGKEFKKSEVKNLIEEVKIAKNDHEASLILSGHSEAPVKPIADRITAVSGGRQVLETVVDQETLEMLEQMANLLAHKGPQTKGELIKKAVASFLKANHPGYRDQRQVKVQEDLFKKDSKNLPSGKLQTLKPIRRYIPAKNRRAVWQRDGNCCSYIDPVTQKRCGTRFKLQFEHKLPFSQGGTHDIDNLALYCAAHNLFMAEKKGLLTKNPTNRKRDHEDM